MWLWADETTPDRSRSAFWRSRFEVRWDGRVRVPTHRDQEVVEGVGREREQFADVGERPLGADAREGDVEHEARQERLRLVVPERALRPALLWDDEHVGDHGRVVGRVRARAVDEVERVERGTRPLTFGLGEPEAVREPERVEPDDAVPEPLAPVCSRQREVLALRVRHDDRAAVVQEVRDDGADALACPRRGDRQEVAWPVVAEERPRPPPPS